MAEDNRIRMPSGQGGLTRYFEDTHSRFQLSPGVVVILALAIIIALALLHYFSKRLFG
ncbi:preprotein translocase subunit Sec61beta [Candidatus Woesearchaeota archaeon]|nr:preprotein translocase subunit Sec61beta [Candidatus Woesearchaeota archaeon]